MKTQPKKMKTTTTYIRKSICLVLLIVAASKSFSQTNNAVSNLQASFENNSLVINWDVTEAVAVNYSEVQSSKDGINFSTIGMVMGADPKTPGSFKFKQNLNKMKAGKGYFRVINVDADGKSYTSPIIKAA